MMTAMMIVTIFCGFVTASGVAYQSWLASRGRGRSSGDRAHDDRSSSSVDSVDDDPDRDSDIARYSDGGFVEVDCRHCGKTNRVPHARLRDRPKCGRCKSRLMPGRGVTFCRTNRLLGADIGAMLYDPDRLWDRLADHALSLDRFEASEGSQDKKLKNLADWITMNTNLLMFGSFTIGFLLAMGISSGGPVAALLARRRGFMVGWELRERHPADASPRTMREIDRAIRDDARRYEHDEHDDAPR